MITIDYKSRVPIYDQIVSGFIRLKALGIIKAGDKIPSVRALALDLGINPNTVQKAYTILENDGIIYSVSGKGSFIAENNFAETALLALSEADFISAVEKAKSVGVSASRLKEIIDSLFEGGNSRD